MRALSGNSVRWVFCCAAFCGAFVHAGQARAAPGVQADGRSAMADAVNGSVTIMKYLPAGQPDGVSDNTREVQAAVDGVHRQGGGEVYFPPGTYVITNVRLYSKVTLRGAGPEQTQFKAKPRMSASDRLTDDGGKSHIGYDAVVMFYNQYGDRVSDVTLRDFTIDGNAAAQTFEGAKNLHGFYLNGVTNALVENVVARNCLGFGGILKEATRSTVRRCRFDDNGRNLVPGYWKRGAAPGGDGFDLMSRCRENTVADSSATGNLSAGFEDEGRLGGYNPVNRNSGNSWANLVANGNRDNGLTLLWADGAKISNLTVTGGAAGPNAAALQVLGSSDVVVNGLVVRGSGHDGVRVWPEVYGQVGTTRRLLLRNATISDTAGHAIVLEGVLGAKIQATIRGVGGGSAVELGAAGYGRTAGYGRGEYRRGEAYVARRKSETGVGTYVISEGRVYELVAPFQGTKVSTSRPTGTGTSPDDGGVWEYRNTVASEDIELEVDYDGAVGAQARYGIHATGAVRLTIHDSRLKSCSDHNIWLDGKSVDPAITRTRSTASGGRGLSVADVQGTLRLSGVYLEGNAKPPSFPRARTVATGSNAGIGDENPPGDAGPRPRQ